MSAPTREQVLELIATANKSALQNASEPGNLGKWWEFFVDGLCTLSYIAGAKDSQREMEQAITDPENQPSQFGTVPLSYMQAENEALRKDALRYRWMREHANEEMVWDDCCRDVLTGDSLDRAIDYAIGEQMP